MKYNEGIFDLKLSEEKMEEIKFYCNLDTKIIEDIELEVNYQGENIIDNIDDYNEIVYNVVSEYCTSKLIEYQNDMLLCVVDDLNPVLRETIIGRLLNTQSYSDITPMGLDEIVSKEIKRKYVDDKICKKLINNKKRHF